MEKSELRKEIRQRKRQFTQQQLREQSLGVISRLLNHPKVKAAQTVLFYYSLPDEVFTHEAVDQLVGQGKRVLLPVVLPNNEMELRVYVGPESMQEDCYHILEPCGATFTDLAKIDVGLIPGMSFDAKGHRLGRGKGYYDRFLAKVPSLYKIGVCFPFQKLDEVPSDKFDIVMDEVI
ncbi:MAG: 5-formyltetrahydrofolate cyclo-ligase [Prevotella sp.]|jgi:5-formyltetrahydrofolate cyclo-ligase